MIARHARKKKLKEGRKGENMSKLFALLLLLFGGIALKKLFNQILPNIYREMLIT